MFLAPPFLFSPESLSPSHSYFFLPTLLLPRGPNFDYPQFDASGVHSTTTRWPRFLRRRRLDAVRPSELSACCTRLTWFTDELTLLGIISDQLLAVTKPRRFTIQLKMQALLLSSLLRVHDQGRTRTLPVRITPPATTSPTWLSSSGLSFSFSIRSMSHDHHHLAGSARPPAHYRYRNDMIFLPASCSSTRSTSSPAL